MGESYIDEPDKWRMIHIPLTPYWLCRHPETRLWHVAEKELSHNESWPYEFRLV